MIIQMFNMGVCESECSVHIYAVQTILYPRHQENRRDVIAAFFMLNTDQRSCCCQFDRKYILNYKKLKGWQARRDMSYPFSK